MGNRYIKTSHHQLLLGNCQLSHNELLPHLWIGLYQEVRTSFRRRQRKKLLVYFDGNVNRYSYYENRMMSPQEHYNWDHNNGLKGLYSPGLIF